MGFSRVNFDYVIFYKNGVQVQGTGGGATGYVSLDIKGGGMAGTGKLILFLVPGNSAAQMGALSGKSKKTVIQSHQEKMSPAKGGY